jgi:endonuclease/exonuclease/phosphatase family metal-dependent hydrolase
MMQCAIRMRRLRAPRRRDVDGVIDLGPSVSYADRMSARRASGTTVALVGLVGLFGPLGLVGCDEKQEANRTPLGGDVPVTVMTYNVQGHAVLAANGEKTENIAEQIAGVEPAFIGVNECVPCDALTELLPASYKLVAPPRAGVSAIYDSARWQLDDHGFTRLAENDDGWGERVALWAQFADLETGGRLLLYATHWCVPNRSPDDACDDARQTDYADALLRHMREGTRAGLPVLFTGDLNIEQTASQVLDHFADGGLVDAVRVLQPEGEIITWHGNGVPAAIPARLDYIFASAPVEVIEARVDQQTVPLGSGSDHYPVIATIRFR